MDAAQTQKSSIRLLFAASTGTIIEWYDFAVFAFCAALVFNTAFFPVVDPITGLIAALSTQAVGFIARPAGGWFFGVLGDRIGRKRALVISLFLMGGATVAMGLLPTYQQIGVFAPLLLLLMRLLQGFAIGGESTGALVLIAESLPAKQRGLWTGFPMIGGPAGNVIATAVIGAVIGHFGSDAFVEWAWRIPFIARSRNRQPLSIFRNRRPKPLKPHCAKRLRPRAQTCCASCSSRLAKARSSTSSLHSSSCWRPCS
jgi:MFS family permease